MLQVTATDLPRLMNCNGSRLMGEPEAISQSDDTVRNEGKTADWIAQQVHSGKFEPEELIDRKSPAGLYVTHEMIEYLDDYFCLVRNGGHMEYEGEIPGDNYKVKCRMDHVIVNGTTLYISDLKYGWRIVEPEMNWTLIAYAISWLRQNRNVEITDIILTIYQPRVHHHKGRVRSWNVSINLINMFMQQIDHTLNNPTDNLFTGEHCYKCPALATCVARRKAEMNAIDASEKVYSDTLDNGTLSFKIDHLERAMTVLKQQKEAYEELAIARLKKGEVIENYSAEHSYTNLQWLDHVTPALIQSMTGRDDLTKPADLITPTQAKKKGVDEGIITAFSERRNKGVKLVRVDADTKAKKMFNPEKKGN